MIGNNFEEAMFIPPKFGCSIGSLVKQNVYLEDSNGHSWRVKIAVLDGSLAFQQGWRDFVLDHSIKIGELVIFEYIGGLLFSARIFGTSACERVHFHEKNNNSICKKKTNVIELPRENIHLPKIRKISEASEDRLNDIKANLVKKRRETQKAPCKSSGIGITTRNLATKGMKEVLHTPDRSPVHDNRSKKTRKAFTLNYSEAPCCLIDEDATREQANAASPMDLCEAPCDMVNQDTSNPRAVETNFYPKEKEKLVTNEEKLSNQGNSPKISQVAPTIGCTKTNKQIESNRAIITCPLFKEGVSTMDCSHELRTAEKYPMRKEGENKIHSNNLSDPRKHDSKLGAEEIVGDGFLRSHSAQTKCSEDEGNLIELDEIGCKFLLTEDGICHVVDENLKDALCARSVTPIDFFVSEKEDTYQDDKAAMPRETSSRSQTIPKFCCIEPILDCVKDERRNLMSTCEEISQNPQQKGDAAAPISRIKNATWDGSGRCAPRSRANFDKYHKDHDIVQGNTRQSGIVPDAFTGDEKNRVTPFLEGKTLQVVKREIMDSIDRPPPNSVHFRFSLPLHAQSLLELPQRLSFTWEKIGHGKKVVILRDPAMRLWPVLYHECVKFVGFIGGWKDFATGNNLRQGDVCAFEVVNESEPTFQVWVSRV